MEVINTETVLELFTQHRNIFIWNMKGRVFSVCTHTDMGNGHKVLETLTYDDLRTWNKVMKALIDLNQIKRGVWYKHNSIKINHKTPREYFLKIDPDWQTLNNEEAK